MKAIKSAFLLPFVFSLLVLLQVSCTSNENQPVEKITYAIPQTIAAMPAYVALEKGFWKQQGLEVDGKIFSSGRLALDALLSNSVEVMSTSETPLVHAILKNNKIFIVTTVLQHQETKLIVRTDRGITNPSDLAGKKIASLPGTNSDYFKARFLKAHNINPSDVKLINMTPGNMVTALVSGDIDGYFAWEPYIYYGQEKLADKTKIFLPGDLYNGRHCVAMNQDYVNAHPEVVKKLLQGFILAEQFIKENPAEAIAITSRASGIPTDVLGTLVGEYKTRVDIDSAFLQILYKEGQWAQIADSTEVRLPDFNNFIYSRGLEDARKSTATHQ